MNINAQKTHGMMDENYYWETVDASTKYSHDKDLQLSALVSSLKEMPLDDIVGFMLRTHQLQQEIYTPQLWCAGYLMNRGYCSDDGFEYFRSWVISNGKDTYCKAKDNPDTLACKLNPQKEFYDFEEFGYAPSYAFTNKTSGKDIYAYLGEKFTFPKQPDINFNWNPEAPNTMQAICPELFEKMWVKNVHNPKANILLRLQTKKRKPGGRAYRK